MTNNERSTDDEEEAVEETTSGRSTAEWVAAGYERAVADGGFDTGFFERIVESVDVGVGVYDETGHFTYVNQAYARVLGREPDSLEGSPVWLVNPTVDEDQFERYWESFDAGETRQAETIHRRSGGSEFPVEIHTTAIEVEGARYHVGTIADNTEYVERSRELQRQDERLEQFASVLSHDLRNPLNVAMGRLRLIEEDCESEHIDPVENSLERMEALIDAVLTLAREGSRLTDPESVSLREGVTTAWAAIDDDAATLEIDDDLGVVQSEESRLSDVFENLFSNAVEHGSTKPQSQAPEDAVEHNDQDVTVRVGHLDGDAGFYVEDDGDGIDPEMRETVFDYGYSTDTDKTGFGLAIVEQIAQTHGWNVELTDGADGGARFEFHDVEIK